LVWGGGWSLDRDVCPPPPPRRRHWNEEAEGRTRQKLKGPQSTKAARPVQEVSERNTLRRHAVQWQKPPPQAREPQ
jgi:hypothetical protein